MGYSAHAAVRLAPVSAQVAIPGGSVLRALLEVGFDPRRSAPAIEHVLGRETAERWFDLAAVEHGELGPRPSLLFPEVTKWYLGFKAFDREPVAAAQFLRGTDELHAAAEIIGEGALADSASELSRRCSVPAALADRLFVHEAPRPGWAPVHAPGVYRREHASLLVCSETTRLLLDPVCLAEITQSPFGRPPCHSSDGAVDAILVTHSHGDHWSIPSVVHHLSASTRVIVPHVPRRNLLTYGGFAEDLAAVGVNAEAPRWGETLVVGDITIDVLPFYGEQPTRDAPGPTAELRSWGNCYRFTTPQLSAMVLVDSGKDPLGDMREVVAESTQRRGPVDLLLSCVREFPAPFFRGLEWEWASLPFWRLRELFLQLDAGCLPSSTAGPKGIVALCQAARARWFLPYSNGFEGPGRAVTDVGWTFDEGSEAQYLAEIDAGLRADGASTQVMPWNVGDCAHLGRAGLSICEYESRPGTRALR